MRRTIALLSLLLLAGCGFHLRGTYTLPFQTLYIGLPQTSELRALLARSIAASSDVRLVDAQKDAQASLLVTGDRQTKNILSISSSGQAQSYQLVRDFSFRLIGKQGRDWLPPNDIVLRRDITFNNDQVLSKESEEVLLWRDIQNDLVQQVLRRLAAARAPA